MRVSEINQLSNEYYELQANIEQLSKLEDIEIVVDSSRDDYPSTVVIDSKRFNAGGVIIGLLREKQQEIKDKLNKVGVELD